MGKYQPYKIKNELEIFLSTLNIFSDFYQKVSQWSCSLGVWDWIRMCVDTDSQFIQVRLHLLRLGMRLEILLHSLLGAQAQRIWGVAGDNPWRGLCFSHVSMH